MRFLRLPVCLLVFLLSTHFAVGQPLWTEDAENGLANVIEEAGIWFAVPQIFGQKDVLEVVIKVGTMHLSGLFSLGTVRNDAELVMSCELF